MAKIELITLNAGDNVEKLDHSYIFGRMSNSKRVWVFLKKTTIIKSGNYTVELENYVHAKTCIIT